MKYIEISIHQGTAAISGKSVFFFFLVVPTLIARGGVMCLRDDALKIRPQRVTSRQTNYQTLEQNKNRL